MRQAELVYAGDAAPVTPAPNRRVIVISGRAALFEITVQV